MSNQNHQWQERSTPARLERRFDFDNYQNTREFLDKAAELSKATNVYPDVSFGRTYVNMTVHLEGEPAEVAARARAFADRLLDFTAVAAAA